MGTPAERVINIGARERRKRLTVGIVALSVGVIIAVLLVLATAIAATLTLRHFRNVRDASNPSAV